MDHLEGAEHRYMGTPQSRIDTTRTLIQKFDHIKRLSQSHAKNHLSSETLHGKTADGKTVLHMLTAYPGRVLSTATSLYRIDRQHYKNVVNEKLQRAKGQLTSNRHPFVKREAASLHHFITVVLSVVPKLIHESDVNGDAPLHFAAYNGDDATVNILLKHGAEPNARNKHGQSPLHKAALYGSVEVAQALIYAGADPKLPDAYGASFEDYIAGAGSAFSAEDARKLGVLRRKAREDPRPTVEVEAGGDCPADGGYNVGREDATLPCSIDRRTDLTAEQYLAEYGLQGRPVILQGVLPLSERCHLSKDVLMRNKPLPATNCCGTDTAQMDIAGRFKCGPTAYPRMTYQQYCPKGCSLHEFNTPGGITCTDSRRTNSNPNYRPTIGKPFTLAPRCDAGFALQVPRRFCRRTPGSNDIARSPFAAADSTFVAANRGQFFMNGQGAGATLHFHVAAYNALFFGYKTWYLTGPRHAAITGLTVDAFLKSNTEKGSTTGSIPLDQCVQRAGDVIFVPNFYGHATRCESGFCTGMGNLYNDIHGEQLFLHRGAGGYPPPPYWATKQWLQDLARNAAKPPSKNKEEGKKCPKAVAFVHINKAGGSSMLATLDKCCMPRLLKTIRAADAPHANFWFHAIAQRQRLAVGKQAWDEAYKFALVRNPWSRQLSMFVFLLSTGKQQSCDGRKRASQFCKQLAKRLLPIGFPEWGKDDKRVAEEFRQWLQRLHKAYPPGSSEEYLFGSLPHGNEVTAHFNASQVSWLVSDKGELLVDEVVRLEDLNEEWPRLSAKLCLDNQAVSILNANAHRRHYSFYYDDASSAILRQYMAVDITRFNYTLEQRPRLGHELGKVILPPPPAA